MKEETYISVCWYDTLRYLGRYVNNRIMKIIEEEGFDKLDTLKILKVSPYLIKLAEEDHIGMEYKVHTYLDAPNGHKDRELNERLIRKDYKGPNHDMWVTFSTHYAEVA